ncbi:MAG: helix-turn-helix transcriptional regulator [Kiritimatiellaeota bacterium]|nr:helix-turn-helix transcriptional regulator [Kiritimatiellota bacterium]
MPEPAHSTVSEISSSAGVLLANRLRTWREQRDIPIKCAAAELGVSFSTWDHWEKGRRFPSMADLNLLAQLLRLPPCLLLCPFMHSQCGYCTEKR